MTKWKIFIIVVLVFSALWKEVNAPPSKDSAKAHGCGRRPMMENPFGAFGSRIVGGTDAPHGAWPWIVSLQQPLDYIGVKFSHLCGGSIVNTHWILTATHCFIEFTPKEALEFRAVMGVRQLSDLGPETLTRTFTKKIDHSEYHHQRIENDISLMLMDRPITYSDYIQPICLITKDTVISSMTKCYIAGWGATHEKQSVAEDILQEAPVNIIDINKCNGTGWYRGRVRKGAMCAGHDLGEMDSCQGDSGGPLMCVPKGGVAYMLVGITSFGIGCGRAQKPGVYTSVQYFLPWITQHMK